MKRTKTRIPSLLDIRKGVGCVLARQGERNGDTQRFAIKEWAINHHVRILSWVNDARASRLLERATVLARRQRGSLLVLERPTLISLDVAEQALWVESARWRGLFVACTDGAHGFDAVTDELAKINWERSELGSFSKASGLPYGFALDEQGRLIADPVERATMARVIELREKRYSTGEIASQLNAEGVVNRRGAPFSENSLRRLAAKIAPVGRGCGPRPSRISKRG